MWDLIGYLDYTIYALIALLRYLKELHEVHHILTSAGFGYDLTFDFQNVTIARAKHFTKFIEICILQSTSSPSHTLSNQLPNVRVQCPTQKKDNFRLITACISFLSLIQVFLGTLIFNKVF